MLERFHLNNYLLYFCFLTSILMVACNRNPIAGIDAPKDSANNVTPTGSIMGTVTDRYAFPIYPLTRAKILVVSSRKTDSTTSNSDGSFSFMNIPATEYLATITCADYDSLRDTITVFPANTIHSSFELSLDAGHSPGIVLAGFQDTSTVDRVCSSLILLGLVVSRVDGFDYKSDLPSDSLAYVRSVLQSKPYVGVTDYTVFLVDTVIYEVCSMFDLDQARIQDWRATIEQLRLVHTPGSNTQTGVISVPQGLETSWVITLRVQPYIRWLTLDYFLTGHIW